ncbi:MAG: hypothetical protein HOP06_01220 [Methylotenera sp.]|nr:hypothetical protein [Methylotenera sp.]
MFFRKIKNESECKGGLFFRKNNQEVNPLSYGIPIGIAIGCGIGVTLHNLAIGIGVGVAIGVAFSTLRKNKSQDNKDTKAKDQSL